MVVVGMRKRIEMDWSQQERYRTTITPTTITTTTTTITTTTTTTTITITTMSAKRMMTWIVSKRFLCHSIDQLARCMDTSLPLLSITLLSHPLLLHPLPLSNLLLLSHLLLLSQLHRWWQPTVIFHYLFHYLHKTPIHSQLCRSPIIKHHPPHPPLLARNFTPYITNYKLDNNSRLTNI